MVVAAVIAVGGDLPVRERQQFQLQENSGCERDEPENGELLQTVAC